LFKRAQFQPDLIPINHQNSHETRVLPTPHVMGLVYDNSRTLITWNCYLRFG
jgi:hypothetical protein